MIFDKIYKEVADKYEVSDEDVKKEITKDMEMSDVDVDNLDEFLLLVISKIIGKDPKCPM